LAKDNDALLKEPAKMLQMVRLGELQLDDCANQLQAFKLKHKKDQEIHEQHDHQDYHDAKFIDYHAEDDNHGPALLWKQGKDEDLQSQSDCDIDIDSDHDDDDSVSLLLMFDITAASEEDEEEEEKERNRSRGRSRKVKGKGKTLGKYEDKIVSRSVVSTSTKTGQTTDEYDSDEYAFQKAESGSLK
jgi:hypothetical protein